MMMPGGGAKHPWAIVTGCTSGMGEEITYRLAREGINIVLVSRSLEKLEQVQAKIGQINTECETMIIIADLCK